MLDERLGGAQPVDLAAELMAAGVEILQLRDKQCLDGPFLESARAVVGVLGGAARVIVNDRVDVALLCAAHGVHLGDGDLSPCDARRLLGDEPIIGISTHSVEEARRAADMPVDYIAIGPIYASQTKPGRSPLGPESVRAAKLGAGKPVVAIGGISEDRIPEVIDAGADGIAVIGAVMVAGAVGDRARRIVARMRGQRAPR